MNLLEKYFILVIVVWRLTHLISAEDGPFELILRARRWAGASFVGKLMDCFYCLSIWIGLLGAWYETNAIGEIILLTFYYSGASLLLEKFSNKNFV
jgi:hypothetical protein